MPTFEHLPIEMVDEIMACIIVPTFSPLAQKDAERFIASMCLVSRRCLAVARRWRYRRVVASSTERLESKIDRINSHNLATSVRALRLVDVTVTTDLTRQITSLCTLLQDLSVEDAKDPVLDLGALSDLSKLTSLKVTGQYERVQLPTTLDELQNLAVSSSLAYTFSTLFNDEAAAALSTIRLLGDDESMSIETSIPRLAAITHRLVLLSIPAHSLRRSTALSRHPELLAVVLANITISRLTSFMNSLVYFHLFDHLRIVEITTTQDMEKLDMCARGLSELAEIIGDGHSGLVSIYLDHDLNPTDDSRFIGDTRYDALRGAINLLTTACKVNGIHVIFERQEYHTFPEDAYSEEFTRVQLEEDYGNYVTYWVH